MQADLAELTREKRAAGKVAVNLPVPPMSRVAHRFRRRVTCRSNSICVDGARLMSANDSTGI